MLIRYGLLAFVFQISSRKEANKTMSRPVFLETLQQLFPELESLPHADTLGRLLERINVSDLERAHIAFINQLIRNKKFRRFLVNSRYSIAIDGTQKLIRDGRWYGGVDWLEKIYLREGKEIILQYIYVLEANLVFPNGLTVPLLSEFLSYDEGDPNDKQDCELKAFKRLASRLKEFFPHLSIMVLLDGLYPNGPLMELCQRYKWEYMIVLPKKCLPSVWKEYKGLAPLQKGNHLKKIGKDVINILNGLTIFYTITIMVRVKRIFWCMLLSVTKNGKLSIEKQAKRSKNKVVMFGFPATLSGKTMCMTAAI